MQRMKKVQLVFLASTDALKARKNLKNKQISKNENP